MGFMVLKTSFVVVCFFFFGALGMEPMQVDASEEIVKINCAFEELEKLYKPIPSLEHIERYLLNDKSVNSYDKHGKTPLHKCIDYLNRDDVLYLVRQLLLKGARVDLFTRKFDSSECLPQTFGGQIVEGYFNSANSDWWINLEILLELYYFGATEKHLYGCTTVLDDQLEEIKENLMPSGFWEVEQSEETLDDLFKSINKRETSTSLTLINNLDLPNNQDSPWILNSMLRLAIGHGQWQLIEPLINKGACLCWIIPTIEGILLQENLNLEKKLLYQKMLVEVLQLIKMLPIPQLFAEMQYIMMQDDVRTFHLIKACIPDFSYDLYNMAGSLPIHSLADYNAYHIFQSIREDILFFVLDLFTKDELQETALEGAARMGNYEMVASLIQAGAHTHVRAQNKKNIIIDNIDADKERILKTLRVLLQAGANPRELTVFGFDNDQSKEQEKNYAFKMFVSTKLQEYGSRSQSKQESYWDRFPWLSGSINQSQVRHWLPATRTALLRWSVGQARYDLVASLLSVERNPFEAWPLITSILKQTAKRMNVSLQTYQDIKKLIEHSFTQGYFSRLPRELITLLLLYITHKSF